MKRVVISVLPYLAGLVMAGVAAAATSFPFLKPGDFSIEMELFIMVFLSGFYILTFTPLVVVAEVLFRKLAGHHILPLLAIPVFGALFPILGFMFFPDRWWPEEPIDMKPGHLVAFLSLGLFSIGTGTAVATMRHSAIAGAAE